MHWSDRRIRFLALAVITTIFIVSMTALVYWAMNIASPRIKSRVFVGLLAKNAPFQINGCTSPAVWRGFIRSAES